MKLYGTPPTRALRPIWLINELELDCEIVPVNVPGGEHRSEEFLALNPAGKVPVLVDGDLVINESVAIALYLAEKRPERGLVPTDPKERGEMYRWLFFLVNEIEGPLWRMARNTVIYPEEQRQPADIEIARREGIEMVAILESHMAEREYFVGDRLSVVDLVAAYTLDWAGFANLLEAAPRLQEFVKSMYARPAAPPTIEEAFAALSAQA